MCNRSMGDETFLTQRIAGSWLSTFQAVTGSRAHKPSFVVFDIGQSGCSIMAEWFRSHEQITFHPDILSQAVRFPRLSVYQRVRQAPKAVYGFTVTVEQLRQVQRLADPHQFLEDLQRGGCRVIYLKRRDALRHAIATLKTYSTEAQFELNPVGAMPRSSKFTVDVSELLDCLKYLDHQRLEAQAMLHGLGHLTLIYEEDLMDPNSHAYTAEKLSAFLEIEGINPVGHMFKLVHQKLTDIVANYDELTAGLQASDYAYLLTNNRYLLT
ncbi:MAG: hypothetical protein HC800_07735 [Phormidesmis sp. RL_2_1]|nr:hypothetical protein [Phormidesmis sp. RL_2_1]